MEEDLNDTASVMSSHSAPVPEILPSEKIAMRQFCAQSILLGKEQKKLVEERRKLAESAKSKKKWLQDWVRENGERAYVLPRSVYQKAEQDLSKEGLESVPPYLRIQKSNSDTAITPAVAESAVLSVERDAFEEACRSKKPLDALIDVIVSNARNAIRTTRETVTMTTKLEKGAKAIEIPEMPEDIAREMVNVHRAQQKVKVMATKHKEQTAAISGDIKRLEPTVAAFMEKCGKLSQQIQIEGGATHRIVKKITARAPKITIGVFEDAVSAILPTVGIDSSSPENLLASFQAHRKIIVKQLQLRLNSIPKSTSSVVKFEKLTEESEEE